MQKGVCVQCISTSGQTHKYIAIVGFSVLLVMCIYGTYLLMQPEYEDDEGNCCANCLQTDGHQGKHVDPENSPINERIEQPPSESWCSIYLGPSRKFLAFPPHLKFLTFRGGTCRQYTWKVKNFRGRPSCNYATTSRKATVSTNICGRPAKVQTDHDILSNRSINTTILSSGLAKVVL